MNRYIAFIDESGSKYKASTPPNSVFDFGLAVGLIFDTEKWENYREDLGNLIEIPEGKAHITDWCPDTQTSIRENVFASIKKHGVVIVYDAIFSAGFHNAECVVVNELFERAKELGVGDLKISKEKYDPYCHSELISGVALKIMTYVQDAIFPSNNIVIDIKTDEVDSAILNQARENVDRLINSDRVSVREISAFNTRTEEIQKKSIKTEFKYSQDFVLPEYSLGIEDKKNLGILSADIIANSLHRHISNYIKEKIDDIRLNSPPAVHGYPLMDFIKGCSNNDAHDIIYSLRLEKKNGGYPS